MKYPLFLLLLFTSCSMNKMIEQEKAEILSSVKEGEAPLVTEERIQSLPEPVKKWLNTTGIVGRPEIRRGWVRQSAQMKMKPGQEKWYTAKAEQLIATDPPAFLWTVRMKMNPLISIKGRDKFVDGKGEMRIRMNSLINVVNEKGEKMDEGTLQRYLGEIVWYPSAALSPFITWEAIDESSAKATMRYKGTEESGIFFFNENGDFVKFSAMRFKGNTPDAKRYEWIITVRKHAVMDGIKIPVEMDATWKLDEGDWTWLKMTIEEIRYN
jgi:hypothetical protein